MRRFTARQIAPWLWFLLAIFVFRVFAQLLASQFELPLLPQFERWHSGALPYFYLVFFQVLIILWLATIALRYSRSAIAPNRTTGLMLLILGGLYFAGNLGRLILGLTVLESHSWFAARVPMFFHFVLASFVLSTGYFHKWGTAE